MRIRTGLFGLCLLASGCSFFTAQPKSSVPVVEETGVSVPIGKFPPGHYFWNTEARAYLPQREYPSGPWIDQCLDGQTGRQMPGQPEGVMLCTFDPEPPPAGFTPPQCVPPSVRRDDACAAACSAQEVTVTESSGQLVCRPND